VHRPSVIGCMACGVWGGSYLLLEAFQVVVFPCEEKCVDVLILAVTLLTITRKSLIENELGSLLRNQFPVLTIRRRSHDGSNLVRPLLDSPFP
jgi:hypothetical protein